ncbi:MAG: GTP-binding protein [Massiliimalia sp.]
MKKTIGILAHVDAGKTTFSEQLLFHTHSIRTRGRVDHQDAFLDHHEIERQRGITVFSGEAEFVIGESEYTLLDTPGHIDFSAEMERAVQIMDYGILLVSCVEGIQGHTRTLWNLLKQYHVPVFLFLNKTDRVGADPEGVLEQLNERFSQDICLFSGHFNQETLDEFLMEEIAQRDETLLDQYLSGTCTQEELIEGAITLIQNRELFPCFTGSALLDQGIEAFLQAFDRLTQTDYHKKEEQPLGAKVFRIRHDRSGSRLIDLKLTSGTLQVKEMVSVTNKETETAAQKVDEIRKYNGEKYRQIKQAVAGDVCTVLGLSNISCGDGIGIETSVWNPRMVPTLATKVIFSPEIQPRQVLMQFRILEEEDPLLQVEWNEPLQEVRIRIMGKIQLEILKELVHQRFGLDVTFGPCEILYRETIASPVRGYGHFEPLRHYAEVHVELSPLPRGSGIQFDSVCPQDDLSQNFQNLVKTHVMEKKHRGVLTGMELTDVKITLLSGRAHEKHTEGGDFREATYRAIRQGLEKTDSIILEPWYSFSIEAEPGEMGKIISDLQKLHGVFSPPEIHKGRSVLTGRGPAATLQEYPAQFTAYTRGAGIISLQFDGYEPCHNPQEVIAQIGYDKTRDVENTSDSVFCSHGSGFVVKWNEAEQWMHLPL